jgi:hypothetical protein
MRHRALSPDQFPIDQHNEIDGPLGSYGEPPVETDGYEGTGVLGARAEIAPDVGAGSDY